MWDVHHLNGFLMHKGSMNSNSEILIFCKKVEIAVNMKMWVKKGILTFLSYLDFGLC